jgi:TonB family protein
MALLARRFFWLAALAILGSLCSLPSSEAQDAAPKRRLVSRVIPLYPALARGMALAGTVRVEAVVLPDGSVKTVDIKGGHPVLAQAAVIAVRKWRWEPAPRESREPVELKFDPR